MVFSLPSNGQKRRFLDKGVRNRGIMKYSHFTHPCRAYARGKGECGLAVREEGLKIRTYLAKDPDWCTRGSRRDGGCHEENKIS